MTEPNGNTQRYRLEQVESKLAGDLSPAILKRRLDEQEDDMSEIKADLKSIRRGLWLAASTFAILAASVFTLIAQQT